MPSLVINFLSGRTLEQKRNMVEKVTAALVETIGCKREDVHILLNEITKEDAAHGGVLSCDKNK